MSTLDRNILEFTTKIIFGGVRPLFRGATLPSDAGVKASLDYFVDTLKIHVCHFVLTTTTLYLR